MHERAVGWRAGWEGADAVLTAILECGLAGEGEPDDGASRTTTCPLPAGRGGGTCAHTFWTQPHGWPIHPISLGLELQCGHGGA